MGQQAPKELSNAAKELWRKIVSENENMLTHHYALLRVCLLAWDRAEAARKTLDELGVTYTDRFGAPRSRPEVAVERDSRLAFIRCMRELGLDLEETGEAPRPPALY